MESNKLSQDLRNKVEGFLKEMSSSYELFDSGYKIREGSTVVFIKPIEWTDSSTILRLIAVVLTNVTKTGNEAMFEELSQLNNKFLFGKIYWNPENAENPDKGSILLEHNFIGEHLNYEQFSSGVAALALSADDIDDKLQLKYGGDRWID